MGKSTKRTKEKKFDRNVEISAPILDPEIIKAIHTPPKGQRIDIKHGGFKALLSDLNSQDSTDEMMPINENHIPSYIGISCAVSGYSNYSSYNRRPDSNNHNHDTLTPGRNLATPDRSRTTSPALHKLDHQVHHVTIDKSNIHSVDEERKELTEKLTASAGERRLSPSPIPPTEDDRHHGAYVGARYCPLPEPSQVVNKHIPLLGIDDDKDPQEILDQNEQQKKVETKIASLYGEEFVEDWRESMTHKAKKELNDDPAQDQSLQNTLKSPKDLVNLKPTPANEPELVQIPEMPVPDVKVLAGVEKQFLNKLLSDENPPKPQSPSPLASPSPVHSPPPAPLEEPTNQDLKAAQEEEPEEEAAAEPASAVEEQELIEVENHQAAAAAPLLELSPPVSPPMSPDSGKNLSLVEEEPISSSLPNGEEHIEYQIRAQSPVDNESSPVKVARQRSDLHQTNEAQSIAEQAREDEQNEKKKEEEEEAEQKLVIIQDEPVESNEQLSSEQQQHQLQQLEPNECPQVESETLNLAAAGDTNDGRYYLGLLEQEKSFILEQIARAESLLAANDGADLDEEAIGKIRSAIGKANLLINKKCNQFRELCEANISNDANEPFATLNDDLAGFWDMMSLQVSDIRKSFECLWEASENNWQDNAKRQKQKQAAAAGQAAAANKPKLSVQREQERRERLQEHINQMKQKSKAQEAQTDGSQSRNDSETLLIGLDDIQSEQVNDVIRDEVEEAIEELKEEGGEKIDE